jgi:hypothetical protein
MSRAPANPPPKASASAGSPIRRSPIAISGRAMTSHPTRNTPVPQITQPIIVPGPLTKTQNTIPAISHEVPSAFIDASMRSLPVLGTSSSLPNLRHDPGTYFRLTAAGIFRGNDLERHIAWRTADSLPLRRWESDWTKARRTISTISRTRRLIDL